jgi:hypothetical protein
VDFARLSNALYSVFELSKFLGLLTIIGREGYIYYWGDTVAKIIMISALDQRNMVFEALENGASHYIVKPITPENVLAVIGAVLGEAQGSRDSI